MFYSKKKIDFRVTFARLYLYQILPCSCKIFEPNWMVQKTTNSISIRKQLAIFGKGRCSRFIFIKLLAPEFFQIFVLFYEVYCIICDKSFMCICKFWIKNFMVGIFLY